LRQARPLKNSNDFSNYDTLMVRRFRIGKVENLPGILCASVLDPLKTA
jgi:hypothetical protein